MAKGRLIRQHYLHPIHILFAGNRPRPPPILSPGLHHTFLPMALITSNPGRAGLKTLASQHWKASAMYTQAQPGTKGTSV